MQINNIFKKDEEINIKTYLSKKGVKDIDNYIIPSGKYIESPFLYQNMIEAVRLFKYHYLQKSPTYILMDSDVDGISSTIIMYNYMKKIYPKWDIKILIHSGKQRGLDDKDILNRVLNDKRPFLIIPDANTNCKKATRKAFDNGTDILVLEHHDIEEDKMIDCGVLVTNQVGMVDRNGSGCLVTHKFLQALDKEFNVHYSREFIDLVALSILSDSMNVTSMQNREYLYWGMFKSRDCIKNNFLNALFDRFIGDKEYTQRDVSFKIIPKLNASIRTDDLKLKQRILLAFMDKDNFDEVCDLCEQTHKNQIEIVNNFINKHIDKVNKNDNVIILASKEVPRSYSGLIAGKLSSECNGKPTIVGSIKDNLMIGSLRSPIPLRTELNNINLVEWASGHEEASGICIKEENIKPLVNYLNTLKLDYEPCIEVLQQYSSKNIPSKLFSEFEPYNELYNNQYIPKPLFYIKGININTNDISIIGSNKRTIKWIFNDIEYIKFNCLKEDKLKLKLGIYENDKFIENTKNYKLTINVVGELSINEWNGNKKFQCVINDIEIKDKNELTVDDIF